MSRYRRLAHDLERRGVFARLRARSFVPEEGEFYINRNGREYECLKALGPDRALMRNTSSGWTFIAHRLYVWPDGLIEWGCSTDGRFDHGRAEHEQ